MWQVQRRILLLFILFLGSLFVFRLWEKSVIFSVPCNVGSLLCQPKYNMAHSQWLLPKGSILVAHTGCFPKRKSTSMFKPCLCCIPWHACKFQLTFNQYFQIILICFLTVFSPPDYSLGTDVRLKLICMSTWRELWTVCNISCQKERGDWQKNLFVILWPFLGLGWSDFLSAEQVDEIQPEK